MTKTVLVKKYTPLGDLELSMKMGLRKPIEGSTFEEQKTYVQKLLKKEPGMEGRAYTVCWKDEAGFDVGYAVFK